MPRRFLVSGVVLLGLLAGLSVPGVWSEEREAGPSSTETPMPAGSPSGEPPSSGRSPSGPEPQTVDLPVCAPFVPPLTSADYGDGPDEAPEVESCQIAGISRAFDKDLPPVP